MGCAPPARGRVAQHLLPVVAQEDVKAVGKHSFERRLDEGGMPAAQPKLSEVSKLYHQAFATIDEMREKAATGLEQTVWQG